MPQYDYASAPADIIARVRRIEDAATAWSVPLATAALQFPLTHPCVVSVLPGIASPARLQQTLAAYRHAIPTGFWQDLIARELIRPDAMSQTIVAPERTS